MIGNLFKRNSATSGKQKFRRTYTLTDFGLSSNVTVPAAVWTKFGTVTVPAQQEVTFGANDPTGGSSISGAPIYLRLDNESGVQEHGKIRFALTNANETNTIVVLEESTQRLSGSTTGDRSIAVLMPEYPVRSKEDSKLILLVYSVAGFTLDYNGTNTSGSIPVTVYQ